MTPSDLPSPSWSAAVPSLSCLTHDKEEFNTHTTLLRKGWPVLVQWTQMQRRWLKAA